MKQALCVSTATVASAFEAINVAGVNASIDLMKFNNFDMNSLATELVDRAICETDTTKLQVIPYITLLAKINDVPSIYVYSRGQVGEQRLSGKCSVGFGGHIEQMDIDATQKFFDELDIPEGIQKPTPGLMDYLTIATVRELREEIGLELAHVITNIRSALNQACLFYNNTDEVGQVHLGVSIALNVGDNPQLTIDGVEVTKGEWVPTSVIFAKNDFEFETWSKLAIVRIAGSFNNESENAIGYYKEKLEEAVQSYKDNYTDIVALEERFGLRVTVVDPVVIEEVAAAVAEEVSSSTQAEEVIQ